MTAAVCDGEAGLNVIERAGAAIHALADLAVADGVAEANVHGGAMFVQGLRQI